MKKILIIAALILAALTLRAQTPADSVSVMLRHLANTNEQIVNLNARYKTASAMVGIGGLVDLLGVAFLSSAYKNGTPVMENGGVKMARYGCGMLAVGSAIIAISYFVMPKGVRLDGNGLVIDLP